MGSKEREKGNVPCHLPVPLGDTEDVPSWEAEHGWDKARHSLGTPLLPAQTARGVCTSGGGSGGGLNPAGPPRGAPGDDKGSGAQNPSPGGRNWAPRKGRRALAAKGAQHQPPCPLCMIHPALHGATGDMGTRTGVGTERTEPGRRRALTSGTAWPQPRGSSCRRSLPGAVSSELGAHRAPRRGNEG